MDRKVVKVILTSCVSWSIIDNEAFGELCGELLTGTYNLPCRYLFSYRSKDRTASMLTE